MRGTSALAVTVVAAVALAPPAAADDIALYPTAQGDFASAEDPGWVYFRTPHGITGVRSGQSVAQFGCGIGPDGIVGCDAVPRPMQIGNEPPTDVPPDADQTVAGPDDPGHYLDSDTLTFTRDVDVLPEGHKLTNGDAFCVVGYQGSVSCVTGGHGFTHYSIFGFTH